MTSSQPALAAIAPPVYAGLGRRAAAYLIDMLVALVILFAVGFSIRALRSLGIWTPAQGMDPVEAWRELAVYLKFTVIIAYIVSLGLFYLAFLEASAWQASIGKRLLHIYVTDLSGRRLQLPRSLGRSSAKCFINVFSVGLISMLSIAVTARKRALHDFAAKTLVMRGRPAENNSLEPSRLLAAFGVQYLWLLLTFIAVL